MDAMELMWIDSQFAYGFLLQISMICLGVLYSTYIKALVIIKVMKLRTS